MDEKYHVLEHMPNRTYCGIAWENLSKGTPIMTEDHFNSSNLFDVCDDCKQAIENKSNNRRKEKE